jgi:hypothetical protein
MGLALIIFLLFLLFLGVGILGIIISIDFFEYLKRYHSEAYKEMSFERPFGMPRADFFFHPINPLKFLPFIFSAEDLDDGDVTAYKKKLKLVMIAFLAFLVIFLLYSLF